ncbi:NACHT, LRR and PYD domains-containing protein 3 isoform X3 [Hydra vulgaris]|uniref:NACHT, LRR and PYD domains-containing protein 3 isoform X3 n=2 Tax=Hydra vulgaris TaxID=6087 RepID=UPI001F5FCB3F|nr:NACHT, LRR and PYD domains-containing protein 3-like isoform X3 [Hydra vulgaris]
MMRFSVAVVSEDDFKAKMTENQEIQSVVDQDQKIAKKKAGPALEIEEDMKGGQDLREGEVVQLLMNAKEVINMASPSKKSKVDLSEIRNALKTFYKNNFEKVPELQPPLTTPIKVNVLKKFVDLNIVDGVHVRKDAHIANREQYCSKQSSYVPIQYDELFKEVASLTLITGIAGIGKTWLLRKLLIDWSNDTILKNVDLVFYLECRKLNKCQSIFKIRDLLEHFYGDILHNFKISYNSIMFIIDGLDELKYFDDIIKHESNKSSSSDFLTSEKFTQVLTKILKHKAIVAGRLDVIWRYESINTEENSKLLQVMGFNQNGVNHYIERNVCDKAKESIKRILNDSRIAKEMSSVPFFLSSLSKILELKKSGHYTVLTMTDLYASIFFYFWQKHIDKSNEPVYKIMENDNTKQKVFNLCKVAYYLFTENKLTFTQEEIMKSFENSFDKVLKDLSFQISFKNSFNQFNGFIEGIETNFGYRYQFVHFTFLNFCASVYMFNNWNYKEITTKLYKLLPIISGLCNKNKESFIRFLANLKNRSIISLIPQISNLKIEVLLNMLDFKNVSCLNIVSLNKVIKACLYESQATNADIKEIDEKLCQVLIPKKTNYEVTCERYFLEHFISFRKKLKRLTVGSIFDNITELTKREEKLLTKCLTNVIKVALYDPFKINNWKAINKIESLCITCFEEISKEKFQNYLPWFSNCNNLTIILHNDIDFLEDIYWWIQTFSFKSLEIKYREHIFRNPNEFKGFLYMTPKNKFIK